MSNNMRELWKNQLALKRRMATDTYKNDNKLKVCMHDSKNSNTS